MPIPLRGVFSLSVAADVEIQYFTALTVGSTGLGRQSNMDGQSEIYTDALFQKRA